MKSQLLVVDDLDSRREIWVLLGKLPPDERFGFLRWACASVPQGRGSLLPPPVPYLTCSSVAAARRCDRESDRLTNECYSTLLSLLNDFNVDAMGLARELERRVRALR